MEEEDNSIDLFDVEYDENKKELDEMIEEKLAYLGTNKTNKITSIHPCSSIYYNSFNIALGKQGSGKTALVCKELIKLCYYDVNPFKFILYIANSNDDETFHKLREIISIPIYFVNYEDALSKFEEYIFNREDLDSHFFIIFEDASFIFRKDSCPWFKWFIKLRHLKCSIWANIHIWRGINPMIKTQISAVFVFPGYSREQMQMVFRQSSVDKDFSSFYACYCMLQRYQALLINNISTTLKII